MGFVRVTDTRTPPLMEGAILFSDATARISVIDIQTSGTSSTLDKVVAPSTGYIRVATFMAI